MENVVREIIEIDRQASERLDNAVVQKDHILENANIDVQKLKEELNKKAEDRIRKVEEMSISTSNMEIAELNKQKELDIKQMDEIFNEIHTAIEESIFKRIVGE